MKIEDLVYKVEEYLNKKYLLEVRSGMKTFVEESNGKEKKSESNDKQQGN